METLERYRAAGVENKLKSRNTIVMAEGIVTTARQRLQPVRDAREALAGAVDTDPGFLSDAGVEGPAGGKVAQEPGGR